MKAYIKSSIFMVLLLAIFSVGFSSANAKTIKKDMKVTNTATIKTVPLRCQMQAIVKLANIFDKKHSEGSSNLITNFTQLGCQAGIYDLGTGYTIIVTSSCRIYQVGPNGGFTTIIG